MKLVIFDCDGTLVDSQHMIVAAMTTAFAAARLPAPEREAVRAVIGLSLEGAVAQLLSADKRDQAASIAVDYKEAFSELRHSKAHQEPLYPGIRETIAELSGKGDVQLAIATGKSRRGVSAVLEREGLALHFTSIQTADSHPSKPHPSMILQAMVETGAAPGDTIMVGDTTFDIEMARAAAVLPVGVGWGYHPSQSLRDAGAHCVIADSLELSTAIDRILNRQART